MTGRKSAETTEIEPEGTLTLHSALDLHRKELSPAHPVSGGPEAKRLFEIEAWRAEKWELDSLVVLP